uniref:acetyl-CoA carboxylase beta subunit n=1 Tax=Ligustrum lucidum TaxID=458695 RepID=UPI001BF10210|nr:acetyl-CoA carboxylase beta subunit [Ligustrum lucidum]QIV67272.1 acetyl-CoA carboxylase beta subunit [Ligustrum lucidum]
MDQNFISNPTFLVRDSKGYFYFIYFNIENETIEIDKDHPYLTYLSERESSFSSSLNNESTSENPYSWDNYLNYRIHSYLQSIIYIDTSSVSDSSDSDLQSPIDIDTSDSSDSDLQSPIDIDTSDSSDSDLQSPIDIDTSDSSDSDLQSPIDIDTSDSSDSDLQSPIDIDTSDSSDSDLQYPIYLDTSIVSDSGDSDLQSPIYIDTSDSSDSDLQSPIDIDTSDSSDSDLQYPIYIDMSSVSDSNDSDLQSPIDIDAAMASINERLERYRESTGTYLLSEGDFKDEIKRDIEAVIASISDRLESIQKDILNPPIVSDSSDSDLQSPIDIDTSDSSDSDLQSPIDIDTSDSSDSDLQSPIDIDTSDSSDSDLQSPIDIDTSDSSDSDLQSPIDIDTSDSSDSDLQSPIDIDTSDSSDSDLQSPIDIDTSDSSDSDLQSPIDLDAAMASIDERLERYREATGTYLLSEGDFKDEIKRDMDAVIAGIGERLESIQRDILNPPVVSDSSDSDSDLDDSEESNDPDTQGTKKFKHLWVLCENETCESLNYKKFLKERLYICEFCGYHLKMNSSDRIELSIDPGTWYPMDEDLFVLDPIEWHSKKHPYKDRIASDQKETGLTEAIQTGRGKLNGVPVALGVMDFRFVGGSMGPAVGEKITRLIEYATHRLLPLIIVCASGGARMQEGSLSLVQMAKISSALYEYQSNKELFYVSILASPTTGGVLASFGMLADIIIAEPNAYIAFAGKRVIEQTLNIILPEGSQETENLFEKGLFDLIVPRKPLKSVLSELFKFHAFFPWNEKRPLLLPLNEKPPLLLPLNATLEHN